jgi:hypothetical protein
LCPVIVDALIPQTLHEFAKASVIRKNQVIMLNPVRGVEELEGIVSVMDVFRGWKNGAGVEGRSHGPGEFGVGEDGGVGCSCQEGASHEKGTHD